MVKEKNLNLIKNLKTEKGLKISPLKNLKKIKLPYSPCSYRQERCNNKRAE